MFKIMIKKYKNFSLLEQKKIENKDNKLNSLLKDCLRRHKTSCDHFIANNEVKGYLGKCEVY